MTVNERIAENAKNSNISESTGFGQSLPTEFNGSILEVGDVITLPTEYIFGKGGNVARQTFNGTPADFVVCKLTRADGKEDTINFFPRSMARSNFVYELDENGKCQFVAPVLPNKGTAVDLMLSFRGKGTAEKTDLALAMDALVGKSIKITAKTTIKTQKWDNGTRVDALRDAHVYTYDLVEDEE